jgi:hypothetical protein
MYIVMFMYAFLSTLAVIWMEVSYSNELPKEPNEKNGYTYRMVVNHGFVVYGSKRECQNLKEAKTSLSIAAICFLVTALVGISRGDIPLKPGRQLNE